MQKEHWLETYKSLISIVIECFKFSALVNGGSAVALLAYLGNISGKGVPIPDMRCPMGFFLFGLFSCGLSMMFGYLTQYKLLDEIGVQERPAIRHNTLLWLGFVLLLVSIFSFGLGAWYATTLFYRNS